MHSYGKLLLTTAACLLFAWAAPVSAGTAQAAFAVQIALNNPGYTGGTPANSGLCTSKALSQATNATVSVICGTNIFVSISPNPGTPFTGVHGGAYRFMLKPTTLLTSDDATLDYAGAGTITTMHIFHEQGQEDTMEMLVSF